RLANALQRLGGEGSSTQLAKHDKAAAWVAEQIVREVQAKVGQLQFVAYEAACSESKRITAWLLEDWKSAGERVKGMHDDLVFAMIDIIARYMRQLASGQTYRQVSDVILQNPAILPAYPCIKLMLLYQIEKWSGQMSRKALAERLGEFSKSIFQRKK
ncbi:MAG: hypothetical protein M1549_03505, partial [Candidatus Dependentiae bacterium]|nr:hypothetical protein [Candidatus Dependentiae bacterium]